jgi:hypothetical protein
MNPSKIIENSSKQWIGSFQHSFGKWQQSQSFDQFANCQKSIKEDGKRRASLGNRIAHQRFYNFALERKLFKIHSRNCRNHKVGGVFGGQFPI